MESLLSFVLHLAPVLLILLDQPHLLMGAAAQSSLTAGSSMRPKDYLTSPSKIFAFGFCNIDPHDPNQLLLAIWFDFGASDCTNKTVVWFARDPTSNQPVIATKQAVLDGSNRLSLVDGHTTLWSPSQQFVSALRLLDSGNLQLHADGDSGALWQSFDHPTHTLLPGQEMSNSSGTYLLSKNTDTDFSPGRFTLRVQSDGNIVLYMRNPDHTKTGDGDPYWASGSWESGRQVTIFFSKSGNLFYNDSKSSYENLTTEWSVNFAKSYYHYVTLDPDGSIRAYAHPKNNTGDTSWHVVSLFPSDGGHRKIYEDFQGFCGPNAYCTVSSSEEQRLSCECPDGYVFMDEQNKYRGCRPNFVPNSCYGKDHSGELTTVRMDNTAWSNQSVYNKYPKTSLEQCNTSCLNNCLCVAVLIDGSSCMEVEALEDGMQGNGTNMTTLIKVRAISSSVQVPGPPPRSIWLYIIIIGILAISFAASITYTLWESYVSRVKRRSFIAGLRIFTHKELYRATNGFKELLGRGSFGQVYKGEVSHLQPPHVAVKTLVKSNEYCERDFENEVRSIGQIHHKNLVRMIGYCKEGVHRMLVFEYMQGGTLADFIFGKGRPQWSCLAEAAIGIAKGLEYLHEGCRSKIIHCDIKPDNILFDDKHTPKITDFGIAKLLGDQTTQQTFNNTIAGTMPYVAPEWFDVGERVDCKVDVYSFGVVLLEMICCTRAVGEQPANVQGHDTVCALRSWAEGLLRHGRAELFVQRESEALADMERVDRFARVAIWCLQKEPSRRPTMRKVVQMLEGTMEVDPLPDPPRPPSFSAILPDASGTLHSCGTIHIP